MTVRRFAEGTKVPITKSKEQVEKLLRDHGAVQLVIGWDDAKDVSYIMFKLHGRMLRYVVEYPAEGDVPAGRYLYDAGARAKRLSKKLEQEHRRRWRALVLILKAKLEMVAAGDATFEREFLADIMLRDGSTVGDAMVPQLEAHYSGGNPPKLLLLGTGDE